MDNIYKPELMEVLEVRRQTDDVKSMKIHFRDPELQQAFSFSVGQFGIFSAFGFGESVFNICSIPDWRDHLEFCFKRTGMVTEALWQVEPGDTIGFRGPYGNSYPMETWVGRNLLFIGGGIAMPPIRCAIWHALEHRDKYGDITIVYGARSTADIVYADELAEWARRERTTVIRTVDPGGETPDWDGEVGFVPAVLEKARIPAANTVALVIGPPVMIKFAMPVLTGMNLPPANIYTSLESRMKCGVGKCGRCNIGLVYVCKEGPVFSLAQMRNLPADF